MNTSSDTASCKRIAIFASGNGTNAENIIRYFRSSSSGATVAIVVCNRPDAKVIERAGNLHIPVSILSKTQINDYDIMMQLMDRYEVDIIVLAGFLIMIPGFLIERYKGSIVNIHPSLLPKYGGKGMYGHHVHEAVIAAGEKVSGITIHHVSSVYDEGRIIFQASVGIDPTDTPDTLAKKIHSLEAEHYPRIIRETFIGY